MLKSTLLALALVAAVLPLAASPAAAMPDLGLPTPCDPMLLDWLCTVWQGAMGTVGKVCMALEPGCPKAALPLLP